MKKCIEIAYFLSLVFMIGCNTTMKQPNNKRVLKTNEGTKLSNTADSMKVVPTSQSMYADIEGKMAVTANLKHDPSTLIKNLTDTIANELVKTAFYYNDKRIIRIENRIYKQGVQMAFRMFDFDKTMSVSLLQDLKKRKKTHKFMPI